uniref:RiPP maturation radical SAM C-methyltransferase n=1 Tax=Actinomadura sp. CA-154981 TaxID=3240037 RepID=UPI003F49808B
MPWHALSRPPLAVGVLRAVCARRGLPVPRTYHAGLRFAEFLLERTNGVLTPYEYTAVAETGFTHALGDWVFAGELHTPDHGVAGMFDYAAERGLPMRSVSAMRAHAGEFVDLVVDELLALDPQLVGFTTTFMQNVPSLAVARRIKHRRPDITVLFGGGNCDGPMGAALHTEYSFVDLVLRGEADETFPLLLEALATTSGPARDEALAAIPQLCWRDSLGRQRVNRTPAPLVPPARLVQPDFTDWFGAFEASVISERVEPELVVESARGCWWGEHHHCTFCGLNGSTMAFRAKPPRTFVAELDDLVRRHRVLDVMVVDNILDPAYLREVLPELARRDWDLRLHYEIKANLTTEQVGTLQAAGVYSVQPGIESLVDDVLTRMDKGVRAVHNIRTMRDCESAGLTVAWNWLYGFPGEREEDYARIVRQLPALVHLQPPSSTARIELNRFSPYFDDPTLGFPVRHPAKVYRNVYDLPPERLHDLVYLFDTPQRGLSAEQVEPLEAAVRTWTAGYQDSSLRRHDHGDAIVLRDRRVGWPAADHVLEDPRERHAWHELEHGRSEQGLLRRLAEAGFAWRSEELTHWLHTLHERGLTFTEGRRWVALATTPRLSGTRNRHDRHRVAVAT